MVRMKISTSIETYTFNKIDSIAVKHFLGNRGKAIDAVIKGFNYGQWLKMMARYHTSQMTHYREQMESIRAITDE